MATAYLGHELELDETYQTQYGEGLGAVILPAGFHSPITGLHGDIGRSAASRAPRPVGGAGRIGGPVSPIPPSPIAACVQGLGTSLPRYAQHDAHADDDEVPFAEARFRTPLGLPSFRQPLFGDRDGEIARSHAAMSGAVSPPGDLPWELGVMAVL